MSTTASCIILFILVCLNQRSSAVLRVGFSTFETSKKSSCKELEYLCHNGQCIDSFNVCDGAIDCSDGSDENQAACMAIDIRCPALAFECSYGACIDGDVRCDGKSDCADGSDEEGCSGRPATAVSVVKCGSGKYACSNDECIDQYLKCDGNKDCTDGSDETKSLCNNLKCPTSSFQCDYGACLEQAVKCNGRRDCPDGSDELGCSSTGPISPDYTRPTVPTTPSTPLPGPEPGGCILPPHPENGVYSSSLCQSGDLRPACRNEPGASVPSNWLLKYRCNANFDLTSNDSEYSVCDNGVWKNPLDCIRLCPPLKSLSVNVKCNYGGREVPCDRPMKPNTTAVASCKQHYKEVYKPEYSSLTCQDEGDWSYRLFYCIPDCGVSVKPSVLATLILNGSSTRQGEFPWLAALYLRNSSNRWEQKCAGTLISPHIVLTAAHCLVTTDGVVSPSDIKVGLGKYYRDFYKEEDYSVISSVRQIEVPQYYSGGSSFYALDIGLLDLVVSVQVTAYVMPACIDWTASITIAPTEMGFIAGWGTTENKTSSESILSTQLQYIDNAACIKKVRQAYKRFVTHDKFCAGTIQGQVDKGDSGGGMTVVRNNQHFVIGVVSTKITEDTSFSLFTNLYNAEHYTWLDTQRTRFDKDHYET